MQSDEQLMEQYVDGDQRSFAVLHARHEPLVRRIVARAGFRAADADDLVQQTFTQLHAARARYRSGERLEPWLCAMTRNVCRDHGRKRKRRPEVACDVAVLIEATPAPVPAEPAPTRGPLVAALEVLSEPTRRIFHQHFLEDRALVDIARDLGAKPSTVRVQVHRGCQQLREALAERATPPPS